MNARVIAKGDIVTEPLEVGPESKLRMVDAVDRSSGAPLSAGICEVFRGAPIDFDYDTNCAVCYMLEGEITLAENGETCPFTPGDIVYIPRKAGLVVFWSTETYGKYFYVTYPNA